MLLCKEPSHVDGDIYTIWTTNDRKEAARQLSSHRMLLGKDRSQVHTLIGGPERSYLRSQLHNPMDGLAIMDCYSINFPGLDVTDKEALTVIYDCNWVVTSAFIRYRD
jgi:hypothetical protein